MRIMVRNSRVFGILANATQHGGSHMVTPGCGPARRHALMRGLRSHHGDALRLQDLLDAVGDLSVIFSCTCRRRA